MTLLGKRKDAVLKNRENGTFASLAEIKLRERTPAF